MTFLILSGFLFIATFILFPRKDFGAPNERVVIYNSTSSHISFRTNDKKQPKKKSYNVSLMVGLMILVFGIEAPLLYFMNNKPPQEYQVDHSGSIKYPADYDKTTKSGKLNNELPEIPNQTSPPTPSEQRLIANPKIEMGISEKWKGVFYFLILILGMITDTLMKFLKDRSKAKKSNGKISMPTFIWEDWAFPFCFSIIIFSTFWGDYGEQSFKWKILLASYQNGFFWPALIQRIKKHV